MTRADPNELAIYEAALAALAVATADSRDDEADIDKATAALSRICGRRTAAARQAGGPRPDGMQLPRGKSPGRFVGMSMSEAGAACLESASGGMRAPQIIEAIVAGGCEVTAEKPEASLNTALKRRAKSHRDVAHVGRGVWKHTSKLTEREMAAQEHKERTLRGMEKARERGTRMGAPTKLDQSVAAELFRKGYSVAQVAKECGVAKSAVYKYFNNEAVRKLHEEGRRRADDNAPRPSFRVVENGQ